MRATKATSFATKTHAPSTARHMKTSFHVGSVELCSTWQTRILALSGKDREALAGMHPDLSVFRSTLQLNLHVALTRICCGKLLKHEPGDIMQDCITFLAALP